ncbi:hypothetical protein AB0I51_38755 [Streptomyces sp. NPDC050549]|uniref:hypothetical protein n=1 Tax=Streptomyces sp. NPDC050549 TaxID=3155406 RepID=UPI00342437EF
MQRRRPRSTDGRRSAPAATGLATAPLLHRPVVPAVQHAEGRRTEPFHDMRFDDGTVPVLGHERCQTGIGGGAAPLVVEQQGRERDHETTRDYESVRHTGQ